MRYFLVSSQQNKAILNGNPGVLNYIINCQELPQIKNIDWSGTEGSVDSWNIADYDEQDSFECHSVEHDCVDG